MKENLPVFVGDLELKDLLAEAFCPYCGKKAIRCHGKEIYPYMEKFWHKRFYLCKPCQAWVGCHYGTWEPLGRLADEPLRKMKMKAHRFFDPIWKSGEIRRPEAYRWLADQMGLKEEETHIGLFDIEQCNRVVEICIERRKGELSKLKSRNRRDV